MFKRSLFFLCVVLVTLVPSLALPAETVDFVISSYNHPHILTGFETAFLNTNLETVIVLSDGSQWIVRSRSVEKVPGGIFANWKLGDEVRIKDRLPEEYEGAFILKNTRNNAVCLVDLDFDSLGQITDNHIDKVDQNGYALITQNGLEFVFGWLGACITQHWQADDLIIINKSSYSRREDYLLINASSGESAWGSLIDWK